MPSEGIHATFVIVVMEYLRKYEKLTATSLKRIGAQIQATQAAADSAVRAVYQCQPYTLPSDKYALWRDMILNFDPSDMYRSG